MAADAGPAGPLSIGTFGIYRHSSPPYMARKLGTRIMTKRGGHPHSFTRAVFVRTPDRSLFVIKPLLRDRTLNTSDRRGSHRHLAAHFFSNDDRASAHPSEERRSTHDRMGARADNIGLAPFLSWFIGESRGAWQRSAQTRFLYLYVQLFSEKTGSISPRISDCPRRSQGDLQFGSGGCARAES
jgi:hypothetical protein